MHKTVPLDDVAGPGEGAHGSRIVTMDLGNDLSDGCSPCTQPRIPRFDELRSQSLPLPVWVQKNRDCCSVSGHVIAYDTYSCNTVLSDQLDSEIIADFADIAGVELVAIDADTRMRDFTRELRWNQAYYRLAEGL